jgi:ppGpp synthetase/RelA/SpoT-type nucleotidyltranferase
MIVPEELQRYWSNNEASLLATHARAKASLIAFCEQRNFPYSGRIKTIESLAEKIESGRYQKISDIEDMIAFTAVVPTRGEVAEVLNHCKSAFEVITVKQRSDYTKPPESFWFDSMRIHCRLYPIPGALAPADGVGGPQLFEVQVRTAFEHAWSTATHDLAYKASSVGWPRLRLAWQLKAAVELLDASIGAYEPLCAQVPAARWPGLESRVTIATHLEKLFDEDLLPREMYPKDVSRVCDNIFDLVASVRPRVSLEQCLQRFDRQLRDGELAPIPRSLSVYQLFLAGLCQAGLQIQRLTRPCHVTDALTAIFPRTRRLSPVFSYA